MSNDSANLSIDFMIGFTIFMIGFIWVVSMVPGLLINLQGFTIDHDAVAYRTGVILVEDPGEPEAWHVNYTEEWDKADVARLGLAVSRDDPNILAIDKVNRFFNQTLFPDTDDYRKKAIFGDYPYRFNISISEIGGAGNIRTVGDPVPDGYGYIRRFVKIKSTTSAELKGTDAYPFQNGHLLPDGTQPIADGNETTHLFAILLNTTELTGTGSTIKDPAYQIIPGKESFAIHLTDIRSNLWGSPDPRADCFKIMLSKVSIQEGVGAEAITKPPLSAPIVIIDGDPEKYLPDSPPQGVADSMSIVYDAAVDNPQLRYIQWEAPVYIYLDFTLENIGTEITNSEGVTVDCSLYPGSKFLHTTFQGTDFTKPLNPFMYNYTERRVIQPDLTDAMVEVAVW
jgi:hypothetical protein